MPAASDLLHQEEDNPRSISDVIEDLGFGWAQIQWSILSYGVWLNGAFGAGLGVLLTVYVANENDWSDAQRASLATAGSLGLVLGSGCGGPLADYIGRRLPIMLAFVVCASIGVLAAASTNFVYQSVTAFIGCFAASLGYPPSIAIVSETMPQKHRVVMQACRSIFFCAGQIICSLVFICDDPSYTHMHWREIFLFSSVPGFLAFAVTTRYLRESPVFLAKNGYHGKAAEVLEDVRQDNKRPDVDISYCTDAELLTERQLHEDKEESSQLTMKERYRIIFGKDMLGSTVALMVGSFTINCMLYGHGYAFPLIATNKVHSAMAPAYQSLIQGMISLVVIIVSIPLSLMLSRRFLLTLGLFIGVIGTSLFAWSGSFEERDQFQEYIYFISQNAPNASSTFSFLIIYQCAVDIYPVQVSSSAAGLVLMIGKIGALCAPFLFTVWNQWWSFYYMLAQMAGVTLLMSLLFLRVTPWEDKSGLDQADDASNLERQPLLQKQTSPFRKTPMT